MQSTVTQDRLSLRGPAGHILQVWVMALVMLMTGVTQSGVVPALLGMQGAGPFGTRTATAAAVTTVTTVAPTGDVIAICTANGIRSVSLADADGPDDRQPTNKAGHGFCSLCATHHGAIVGVAASDVTPLAVVRDAPYMVASGHTHDGEIPRVRHSRAPPFSI